jgi:hypothetical protein
VSYSIARNLFLHNDTVCSGCGAILCGGIPLAK